MNNKVIENTLKRALNEAPSLDFSDIINTPYVKMTEHDFITRQSATKKIRYPKQFAVGFVSFAILLLCLTGWFVQYRLPDSSIMLDVNPSIKIVTNKQNRILSVEAINQDAKIVLEQVGDHSTDLNQMVPLIINTMINQGYLSSEKNVVMVSVENKSTKKANTLASAIHQLIQTSALTQNINPQILQQTLQKDKEEATLADRYHISDGKIRLIKRILASNPNYTVETLSTMSMEELLDIAIDNKVDLSDLMQTGPSSDKANTNIPTKTPTGIPNTGIAPPRDNTKDDMNESSDENQDSNDEDKYDSDQEEEKVDKQSTSKSQGDDKEKAHSKSDDSKKHNGSGKPSTEKEEDASSDDTTEHYENSQGDDKDNISDNTEYDEDNNSEDNQSKASSSDAVKNDTEENDTSSELSAGTTDSSNDNNLYDNRSDNEASDDNESSNNTAEND